MKNILKFIYNAYTKVFNSFVSFFSVFLFSSFNCNRKIKKCILKNKNYDECIILGNGPSINTLLENNSNDIYKKDIFAVNFFCITKFFVKVKPNFYVLLDPFLFDESSPLASKIDQMINSLNSISWNMVIFIPTNFSNSSFFAKINNKKLTIIPFNSTPVEGVKQLENFFFQRNLGMPMPQTVINAAIFLAINLKFKNIHLYGVEQSWLKYLTVNNDNKISVGLHHFYNGSDETDENRTLSEFLLSQVSVFRSHMRLKEYAISNKIHIFNHTPGSYIDAYDRIIL